MNGCYNVVAGNSNDDISYIQVNNKGLFMANFEVTYQYQGQIYTTQSYEFPDGISKRIVIPSGATKIYLRIEIATFIGVWSTVYLNIFDTITQKCFEVEGTTATATCKEVECQSNGNNGNCCCCCCNCSGMGNTNPCTSTCMNSCDTVYTDPCTSTCMNSCDTVYTDPCTSTCMNSCDTVYTNPCTSTCMNSCDMSCNGMMNNYMCY